MTRGRIALVAVVAAVVAGFFLTRPSDEKRIERRLESLAESAARDSGEGKLQGLAAARAVAEGFAEPFEVVAPQLGFSTHDRRELIGGIHAFRLRSERFRVRIADTHIELDSAMGRALMLLDIEFATGAVGLGRGDRYRFRLDWVERDGEWRIDRAELLEIGGR